MNDIYIESQTLLENKPAVEWLDGCGATWGGSKDIFSGFANQLSHECIYFDLEGKGFWQRSIYDCKAYRYTHTPTALEFCQGVAKIMGIPEPTFEYDKDKAFWDSEEAIIERAKNNPMVIDPELYGAKVETKTYPHKTYRILDSLDGIPLDTRMPLNEWIPPCKFEVLFISKDRRLLGEFVRIDFEGVIVRDKPGFHFTITDGHWMRIV